MEVDSTALKPTPDGKMSMDTPDTDELKAGTAVVSTENVELRRLRELAGQPAAPAAGGEVDPGEHVLDIQTTPEIDAFIEANTVRDAEGDVDLAGTFGQLLTKASANMDVKGLQDALAQANVKLDNFEKDPQFLAASPEDQADFRKNLPQIKQTFKELVDGLVKIQQTFAAGGKQLTDFSKDPSAPKDNPMKGVKSFVPPVEEGTEDGKNLGNGFILTTTNFNGQSVPAVVDTDDNTYWIEKPAGTGTKYGMASYLQIVNGKADGKMPGDQTKAAMKAAGWKVSEPKQREPEPADASATAPFVPKDYQTKEPLTKGPDGKWYNKAGQERDSLHGGPVNNGAAMFRSLTPRPPTQESVELTAMLRIAGLR
jgi:hypothetical protein